MNKKTITRFAPSPTGLLHLGHIASIMFSYDYARENNGAFLVRIEDIDSSRCKKEYTNKIIKDLDWLNISYYRTKDQSLRKDEYKKALSKLQKLNLIYPCWLSRSEAINSATAPVGKINHVITDTDLILSENDILMRKKAGFTPAWRLRMKSAINFAKSINNDFYWNDIYLGKINLDPEPYGDVIIARKDISTSYHLSVTIDDNSDNITHVTRGNDLIESTHIHRLLQIILSLKTTTWFHHPLIFNKEGKKLSKRDLSTSIESFRENGFSAPEVINIVKNMLV